MKENKRRKHKGLRLRTRFMAYRRKNLRRGNVLTSIVYHILTALVILVLIDQAIEGRYENCFTCSLTLILFLMPNFFEKRLKVTLPQTLEVIIILFIFAAEMLGEIGAFYLKFHWWDDMLHTMNGFLMAAIGFSMVDILNKSERTKFRLSPMYIALVSFCFSMTIGVLWEFFEFSMDYFFMTDMQKDAIVSSLASVNFNAPNVNVPLRISGVDEMILKGSNLMMNGQSISEYTMRGGYLDIGLYDTMNDLFVNFIGAVVFSILGFVYVKNRGKGFAGIFIPKRSDNNKKAEEKQK